MLNNFFRNYFGFNKQQRNGLLVLILISFLLLAIRIAFPYFIKPGPLTVKNLPLIELQLDSAAEPRHYSKTYEEFNNQKKVSTQSKTKPLFQFDPNTVTREQLIELGFRPKAAKAFIKFRTKGFVFKNKTDVKKVYGVSDKLYARIEPFITIQQRAAKEKVSRKPVQNKTAVSTNVNKRQLELNSADSLTLLEIDGIGPSFAKRILKYRGMIGGFVSVEQLKEVYGFNNELYAKVSSFFTADASKIRKVNLNKDDFKTINKHPYLSYDLTKSICKMRRKTTIDQPVLQGILSDENLYRKLLPYLDWD